MDKLTRLWLAFWLVAWLSTLSVARKVDLGTLAYVPSGLIVETYKPEQVYNGYLVFCPEYEKGEERKIHGPRIYHASGAVFWAGDEWRSRCMNAQLASYNDEEVLTFWYDNGGDPYGAILNSQYDEIAQVKAVGGYTDLHEFRIAPGKKTATLILMENTRADLTVIKGNRNGRIYSPVMQEIDIATNKVVWQWHAAEYLKFDATYRKYDWGLWEYAHANAFLKDSDGDYLISFRYYNSVMKIDGTTKGIIWQLGGKNSDFTFNNGSQFLGQHDPQWVPGTDYTEMTIFDNDHDECSTPINWGTARGIWIRLDYKDMSVTLVREYLPTKREHAIIEGGVQVLPNGNVLVAYGSSGGVIEYTREGEIVFEGYTHQVYRAFKHPKILWRGTGLPDPEMPEVVEVPASVSMVFQSSDHTILCAGLTAFLGLC